ncbi:TauD/TfdA family dioxygenase [Acidisphaera sp. L21]|uniref:TauD/TfdA dioxygenase family protein n=1 Tax=Acidisphaera sp. L21 TaxID=1641851 RepID=UPI00131E33D8|nr:TauD/TfdA family dioxygenase [Acidisphaera sp. L21]
MAQQTAWRAAAAARGLGVRDLSDHVGIAITGLDLAQAMDAPTVSMLRAACAERTVILFAQQQALDPAGYLAFARRFGGRPDLHSQRHYCLPDHHEIFVVGNAQEGGKKIGASRVGLNWHTDHYHLPEPGLFTFLHALQVPSVAGDTRYANGMAALDALPADLRARIDPLQVLHSRARLFRMLFPEASEAEMEAERQKVPDVIHPLVRLHPELQRHGLYLGGEWGSTILGLAEAEAQVLFDSLLQHLIADPFCYQHAWQPGDVLMSDNRCSMHRASEWDEASEQRRLHRIILIDDQRPVH